MVQLVTDEGIFWGEQGFKQPCIGIKAAGIENGILTIVKPGNLLLQLLVDILKEEYKEESIIVILDAKNVCEKAGTSCNKNVQDGFLTAHTSIASLASKTSADGTQHSEWHHVTVNMVQLNECAALAAPVYAK